VHSSPPVTRDMCDVFSQLRRSRGVLALLNSYLYTANLERMKALTIVDALSNDRPPEKRKVDSSILSLTTTDRHGRQPAAPAFRLFKGRFRLNFSMSAGVCRGMPSCPWGSRGDGPGRGLVGFLWGTLKAFADSRRRPFRDSGLRFAGEGSRLGPRGSQD